MGFRITGHKASCSDGFVGLRLLVVMLDFGSRLALRLRGMSGFFMCILLGRLQG